jgi:hypothetical protein
MLKDTLYTSASGPALGGAGPGAGENSRGPGRLLVHRWRIGPPLVSGEARGFKVGGVKGEGTGGGIPPVAGSPGAVPPENFVKLQMHVDKF